MGFCDIAWVATRFGNIDPAADHPFDCVGIISQRRGPVLHGGRALVQQYGLILDAGLAAAHDAPKMAFDVSPIYAMRVQPMRSGIDERLVQCGVRRSASLRICSVAYDKLKIPIAHVNG